MAETVESYTSREIEAVLGLDLDHTDYLAFRRPIQVLAVMTDDLRAEMLRNADEAVAKLTAQVAEMQQQAARLQFQMQDANQVNQLRQQVAQEQAKADAAKAEVERQRQAASNLENGALVQHSQLDGFGSVSVGDTYAEVIRAQVVILKDGIVVEIREQSE